MFQRKLRALNCYVCDDFDINDVPQYRGLISWLEDRKIRLYKIDDRAALRDIESDSWPIHYMQYLSDLECPFNADQNDVVFDWILTLAVRLDYEDNSDRYEGLTADSLSEDMIALQIQSNPLDKLDFNSKKFKEGVSLLASMVRVAEQPFDHRSTLKAVSILMANKMSCDESQSTGNECRPTHRPHVRHVRRQLEECDVGFHVRDRALNNCAKVLRLLYINDLRQLETQLNELMASVHSIIAIR